MTNYRELFKKILVEIKKYQGEKDYKKFKKIDTHEHVGDGADFEAFLEIMEEFCIEKVWLMPTGDDKKRQRETLKAAKTYPQKFVAFGYTDKTGKKAEQYVESLIKEGIKGLKLLFWHPNIYSKKNIALDSPQMWRLFEICGTYNIPILAHMGLARFPELQDQLERTLTHFSGVRFIIPHYVGLAPDLVRAGKLLDKYPNLYTDVSMGGGKNRYAAYAQGFKKRFRIFFKKWSKKIFWGTDMFIEDNSSLAMEFYRERIKHDINMLNEQLFYSPFFPEDRFLQGLHISDEILQNVFYKNAKKFLTL